MSRSSTRRRSKHRAPSRPKTAPLKLALSVAAALSLVLLPAAATFSDNAQVPSETRVAATVPIDVPSVSAPATTGMIVDRAQVTSMPKPEPVAPPSTSEMILPASSGVTILAGETKLIHPVGKINYTSNFGHRKNPTGPGFQSHNGQDYGIACGSPVRASAPGVVTVSGWAGHSGQRITIEHDDRLTTGYSHNSKLVAQVGDEVQTGDLVALAGTTGNSTGCHVHFEVIVDGQWKNPRAMLPEKTSTPSSLTATEKAMLSGKSPTEVKETP